MTGRPCNWYRWYPYIAGIPTSLAYIAASKKELSRSFQSGKLPPLLSCPYHVFHLLPILSFSVDPASCIECVQGPLTLIALSAVILTRTFGSCAQTASSRLVLLVGRQNILVVLRISQSCWTRLRSPFVQVGDEAGDALSVLFIADLVRGIFVIRSLSSTSSLSGIHRTIK